MGAPVLVIGIGNEYRGDDGVGLAVARDLRARKMEHVRLMECDGNCTTLLEAWQNTSRVILIDAVSSGVKVGTIRRFDVHTQHIPTECAFSSTHAFGLGETLVLARTLNQLPPSVIVYGVECGHFAAGDDLSALVRNALPAVVEQVLFDIRNH